MELVLHLWSQSFAKVSSVSLQSVLNVCSWHCISAISAASLQSVLLLQLELHLCSWSCRRCILSVASAASPKLVLHFYRWCCMSAAVATCLQLVLHLFSWWCISAVGVAFLHLVLYLCCMYCISAADTYLLWLVLHWFFHFHAVFSDFCPPLSRPRIIPPVTEILRKTLSAHFWSWLCMSISLQLVLYLCSSGPNSPADASALQQVLQLFSWCCNAAVGVATLHLSKWCCLTLAGAALIAAGAASAAGARTRG